MKFPALVLRLSEFHALWRRVSTALSYRETRSDFPGLCYPANQWSANDRWSLLALYLPVVRIAFVPCKLLHHGLTLFPPQRNRSELCCKGSRLANKDGRRLCCQSEFKVIREFQKRWPKQQRHKSICTFLGHEGVWEMTKATATSQTNDLIGWMRKNNRAARAARFLVQILDYTFVVFQTTTRQREFAAVNLSFLAFTSLITIRAKQAKVPLVYFVQRDQRGIIAKYLT